MKICPRCSRDNDDALVDCCECGTKLDIVEKAAGPANSITPDDQSFSLRTKLFFWLGAWGSVILVILATHAVMLRAAPEFPVGLFVMSQDVGTSLIVLKTGVFIFGWVLYAALSAVMFMTKKRIVVIVTYVIFCILLIINIGGCERLWKSMAHLE